MEVSAYACTASFTTQAAPINNDLLRITIINSSSYGIVPTGYREYTRIDFGDGTVTAGIGGGGSGYHSYSSPGVYTVKLVAAVNDTLTGSKYCEDSTTSTITVSYPSCGTIVSHLNDTSGIVTFSAINPAGAAGIKYTWYFGDGSHDTGATVSHTYLGNGVYTVTLTDTSISGGCNYSNGFNDTISSGIYYCDSIHASIVYFDMGTSITMLHANYTNPYPTLTPHETFIFGDGTTGSGGFHTYPGYGKYLLKLVTNWVDTFSHIVICKDTVSDTVRLNPPPPYIEGNIYFDSTGPFLSSYDCKVWLISFDTLTNIVTAVDSVTTVSGFTFRSTYPIGTYLIKAKAIYDTSGYGYVPTYYASGMYWNTANKINYIKAPYNNADIIMKHGTATSGPGFIGGNVLFGAGKTTGGGSVGAPVGGLHVMLLNSSGKLIKQTYTDMSGMYSFSNLPLGSYSIFPESLGYLTTPANTINLTSGNPTDTSVNFTQNSTSIFPAYLSIGNLTPNAPLVVFPNPSKGWFTIIGNNSFTDAVNITVTNMAGQIVYSRNLFNTEQNQTFNCSFLPAGTYIIDLRTSKGNQIIKMDITH